MFARDKDSKLKSDERGQDAGASTAENVFSNLTPSAPERAPAIVSRAAPAAASVPSSTPVILPREARSDARLAARAPSTDEPKKLIVGQGISLDGKISSCDRLIIDGKVQAELEDCHTVEVTANGTFKGAAEIAGADISGQYEGSLTVRENLLIRATGRVSGTVRYGRLHIEDGGEINGDVKSIASGS